MTSTTQAEELTDKNLEAYITRLVSEKGDDVSLPVDALTNSFGENLKLMLAGGEMREYFENACNLQGQDVDVVLKKLANWTPLLFATYDGAIDDVKAIVAQEGDAAIHHALKAEGTTPLIVAAEKGDILIVKELLGKDASISLQNKAGKTARDVALANKHAAVVTAIDESQLTGPKLYQAVYRNDIDAVRALLERGADPTWKTVAGKMPIDIARGDPAILALLEERIAANNTAKPKGTKGTKRPKAKEDKCQIM
ncbi:hypothetical protein DYB30_012581 [Aphanomyces astaci]|uniref:Ankyrin repeat domain-containing protein n=1 Tax=Aphanomyces astaci TaxID=112090 RepID=A0A397CED6_APHAT|nr:hypothetical protein DYB36_012476 [Aphanomyces astaci]RHY45085.1 hypothetical protein DYB30_012581 [Aphanomyces astaci]